MNEISDFFTDSIAAAQSFLQTAVIIDDKLFEKRTEVIPRKLRKTTERKPAVRKKDTDDSPKEEYKELDQDPHRVSTQDLIHSFAKNCIVCSAYQPKRRDFSTGSGGEFRKLCKNADIIIVDWSMFGDDGQRAKDIISGIVLEGLNDTPEQLRLIVAYTGESNLFEITNKIFVHLQNLQTDVPAPENENNLAIRYGPTRVVILGKKNGRNRLNKYQNNEVDETELADRAIYEYTLMTSGLISNVALHSLAALRANSRKILSKFSPGLDAAFLCHRILSLPDENAESHLLEMMSSEFYAVIEDWLDTDILPDRRVEKWIEHNKINIQKSLKKFDKFPDKADPYSDFKQLCLEGVDAFSGNDAHPFKTLKKNGEKAIKKRIILSHVLSGADEYYGDYELAHNMALRTFYSDGYRFLTLGTILCTISKDDKDNVIQEYWICVQPRCDSVRIEKPTPFPFLRCKTVPNNDYNSKRSIVIFEKSKPICINVSCKPNNISIFIFKPDQTRRIVSKCDDASHLFYFKSVEGPKFCWAGELKFEHAQRIAQELSDQLSRVGLAESEWLRIYKS